MAPTLFDALSTLLFLLFVVLPPVLLLGGLLFVPKRREFWTWRGLRGTLQRNAGILLGLLVMLGVVVAETQIDSWGTKVVENLTGRSDFTPLFERFERKAPALVQGWAVSWGIILPLAIVYVVGFPIITHFTPILFVWLGKDRLARRAFWGYVLSYLLALPFYLFFPVNEAWTTGIVRNLAIFHPWVYEHLYAFNEVSNSFPSLHTGMSLVAAHVAARSGHRSYGVFATVLAGAIVLSTVALGIHWVLDVVGGFLLAGAVLLLLERVVPLGSGDLFESPRRSASPEGPTW